MEAAFDGRHDQSPKSWAGHPLSKVPEGHYTVPLGKAAIVASVERTGRCVILHEASRFGGFGGELSALVQERCFFHLRSPIERAAGWDTPYPHAFEWDYFPGPARVVTALRRTMEE
jgi:2-oxoisovalerate dehydrogenase E1 component beta subunit